MLWQSDWEAKKSRKCNENQAKKKDRADYKRLLKSKHILLGTLGLDAVELEIWLDLNCMNFEQEKRKWRGKQSKQANKHETIPSWAKLKCVWAYEIARYCYIVQHILAHCTRIITDISNTRTHSNSRNYM